MNPQNLRPPWPRGISGNPHGRPAGLVSAIRKQTKDGAELVTFFCAVFRDPKADLDDRMTAATWLADRAYGKPAQSLGLEVAGEQMVPLSQITQAAESVTAKLTAYAERHDRLSHPREAERSASSGNDGASEGPQADCKSAGLTFDEKWAKYFGDGRPS
jgi:hypothetical protein